MTSCPSPDQLEKLLADDLEGAKAKEIEAHLDSCSACQQALEALTSATYLDAARPGSSPVGAAQVPSTEAFALPGVEPDGTTALTFDPPSSPPLRAPAVEGYRIVRELGRGGMGVVYLARQLGLNRLVALKMILAGDQSRAEDIDRFRSEAEAVARLQHPHIVQIYEVGNANGHPFFSLEYVEGDSLAAILRGVPQPAAEAAKLVQVLAETVHYAHDNGILHRDLKPSNILLSRRKTGSPSNAPKAATLLAGAVPKIVDFGLAKHLDIESDRTVTGTIMGTPSYMAPEQASGQVRAVGPAADVYALGAILYELLTGRPPFRGETMLETLEQVRTQEAVPPRRLQPKVPADLETICLKSLHRDVARRYAGAQDLADDLRRFLAGEPIRARPATRRERLAHWVKRRPVLASLLALTAFFLAVSLPSVTWLWQRAETKAQAEAQANEKLTREISVGRIGLAQSELAANNVGRAEELLDGVPAALRGWEWHFLKRRRFGLPVALTGHDGRVMSVAFTSDGSRLVSAGFDGSMKVYDPASAAVVLDIPAPNLPTSLFGLAVRPDGTQIATASGVLKGLSGHVKIWDLKTGRRLLTLRGHTSVVQSVAYSPDGLRLASASWDKTVKLWDTATGNDIATLRGHTESVACVAYSPDGRHIASASWDGTVKLWEAATRTEVRTLRGFKGGLFAVGFSPDGRHLAAGGFEGIIKLWDLTDGRELRMFEANFGVVLCLAYSGDGSRLAAGGMGKTVQVWDPATGKEMITLRGHTDLIGGVAFSKGGRLASASWDGSVRLWDGTPLGQTPAPELRTLIDDNLDFAVAIDPQGKRLVSGNNDGGLHIWDVNTGEKLKKLAGHDNTIMALAFRPDGLQFASTAADKKVTIWDAVTGAEIRTLPGIVAADVKYSPDGRHLATAVEKYVKLWDAATGQEVASFAAEQFSCYGLAFAPDGRRLATVGWDQTVSVWNVEKRQRLIRLEGHEHILTRTAFSHDGRLLASGSWDGTVKIWDAEKGGNALHTLRHGERVMGLAFHPKGNYLASAGMDGTVKIWDLRTGKEETTLRGHMGAVWSLDWDQGGRRLISASGNRGKGEIKIWDTNNLGEGTGSR
jgi:WD40 repeat protein/serine/threonine protein kinase